MPMVLSRHFFSTFPVQNMFKTKPSEIAESEKFCLPSRVVLELDQRSAVFPVLGNLLLPKKKLFCHECKGTYLESQHSKKVFCRLLDHLAVSFGAELLDTGIPHPFPTPHTHLVLGRSLGTTSPAELGI